jgi:hypothetical protein
VSGELDPHETPNQRLTPERVGRYILSLRGRVRDSTVAIEVQDLAYVAALLAPDRDWAWIRRHQALPSAAEVRVARKPIEAPDAGLMIAGGLRQCGEAAQGKPSIEKAILFRDGLIVAFATWSALRRKNLAELEIGRHVRIGNGCVHLVLDSLKNGEPIASLLPGFLCEHLHAYLDRYRPVLLRQRPASPYLWLNAQGGQNWRTRRSRPFLTGWAGASLASRSAFTPRAMPTRPPCSMRIRRTLKLPRRGLRMAGSARSTDTTITRGRNASAAHG